MKGLLIKDWYQLRSYCRSFLLIAAVFLVLAFLSRENTYFLMILGVLAGVLPMTLLAYDERGHWNVYSQTLPYTRGQYVSAKYLIGLMCAGAMVLLVAAVTFCRDLASGHRWIWWPAAATLAGALLSAAILLPLSFRFGTEKARIFYYAVIGITALTGACLLSGGQGTGAAAVQVNPGGLALILAGAALAVYALSWMAAVPLYRRREL